MFEEARRLVRYFRTSSDIKRLNAADRETAARWQDAKLRRLLRHAVERSPYYREAFRGIDVERAPLEAFPTLPKDVMMTRWDDIVTDPALKASEVMAWLHDRANLGKRYKGKFLPFQSSGSSDYYALTCYTVEELDFFVASIPGRRALPRRPSPFVAWLETARGYLGKRLRLGYIVVDGRATPVYTLALHFPWFAKLSIQTKTFPTSAPTEKLVEMLNEFRPNALVVQPSVLKTLAREKLAGRLHLRFDDPLSHITSSSEPLTEDARAIAKRAWGLDVQDSYSMTECFATARGCSGNRLHVMEDACVFEVVDAENRPVPDGQLGRKVLVTNLFNLTQPLIRYEVTDVTGFSTEPCDCGWPFRTLLPVQGRSHDTFYVDRPGGGYVEISPWRLMTGIHKLDELHECQFIQVGRNELVFNYVAEADIKPRVGEVFAEILRGMSVGHVTVEPRRVESIPRHTSGKFRRFVSEIGAPADLEAPPRAADGRASVAAGA